MFTQWETIWKRR